MTSTDDNLIFFLRMRKKSNAEDYNKLNIPFSPIYSGMPLKPQQRSF